VTVFLQYSCGHNTSIASAPPRPFAELVLIVTMALLNVFLGLVLPYFAALAVGLSRLHG